MKAKFRAKIIFMLVAFLIFTTLFAGCNCKKKKFVDQGEVGKYYSYLDEETYSLELDEGKFTLNNLVETLNGSYTFDGSTLDFTFENDKKSVNVDYKENIMSFSYKGYSYTFYRDVNYTVTFSAGSNRTLTIKNGQKCEKPQDPEKENHLFVNWYKDSSYLTVFDFEKEVITSDTTIYARFVAKEKYDYEYTVSFDTGIEGVNIESVETFNNTLYTLPTVDVEGKTFIGWWISDYEDGSKLTYEFLPMMEIKQDIVLYAVYANSAPLVSVNERQIAWDNKGVNKQYAVNIRYADDLAEEPVFTKRVNANYVEFDFNTLSAGNYVVEVTTGDYTGKAYYCNKKLTQVCKFEIDGFKLTWNKVENATNYLITVECGLSGHQHKMLDLGDVNEYDFSECLMPDKGIKFIVTAKANGYMSSTSKEVMLYRELSEVTNVTVDAATQTLMWDVVENATSYKVTILTPNGQTYTYTTTNNMLAIDSFYGNLSFTITPVAQGCYAKTTKYDYNKTALFTPTNIKVIGCEVLWDAVEGAIGYNIKIGDKLFTSSTNAYTLTLEEIETLDEFVISVQAVATEEKNNSLYSPDVFISKDGVNTIEYKNGVISWNSVPFVGKYAVKVDDSEIIFVENDTQVDYKITSGKHTIYVTAVDNEGNYGEFFPYAVEVYALILNTSGGETLENLYFVKGDKIPSLPIPTFEGYNFIGWYDIENGAVNSGNLFTAETFEADTDIEIFASWNGKEYVAKLDYATYGSGEIDQVTTQFGSPFTLPIPKTESNLKAFIGWYSELNAQGERYTNEQGKSLKNWRDYGEVTLYAGWVDVFTFDLINDGKAYSVSKGPGIGYVSTITIPTTYLGLPVTTVEASAFQSCSNLITVNIPASILNVEVGSQGPNGTGSCFQSCTNLQAVNVYPVEGLLEEDIRYFSVDGVLIYRNEYNGYEIKYFPYNTKGGTYTIPSIVTTIPINAFKSCSKITEIIIPATVTKIDENAFQSCSKLTTVTFLNPEEGAAVQELMLGSKVFASNTSLEVINLPARLTSFNADIFNSCSKLVAVNITGTYENAVYSSMDGVLMDVDKTEIIFFPRAKGPTYTTPVGIQTIRESAFDSCKGLIEINISGQVTLIEKNAFKSCTALEKINFLGGAEDSALTIKNSAFYGCNNASLTEVTLPANLTVMEKNAFGGTSKLTKVNVYAVSPNINFEYAAFGTTTTSVSISPTYYVKELFIAKEVAAFDITGVFGSKVLAKVVVEEGNTNYASIDGVLFDKDVTKIVYYPTEREGNYVVPETVVEIGAKVFENKTGITSITISKNVKLIGTSAFANCTNLKEVIFEEGGTEELVIGSMAFYSCRALVNLQLPERLTQILDAAFKACEAIPEIVIPSNVKSIGAEAFQSCSSAVRITLPTSLEVIVESGSTLTDDKEDRIRSFDFCKSLTEFVLVGENENYKVIDGILYRVVKNKEGEILGYELLVCPQNKGGKIDLPSNVIALANRSFYQNKSIEELTFSNGIDTELSIGSFAFYECTNLSQLELPNGLKNIGTQAFYRCDLLREVVIPNTVEFLPTKTFYYCSSLNKITFEEGGTVPLELGDGTVSSGDEYTYYYGTFAMCDNLETIILPERLTTIGKYAFAGMSKIKTVYIPSTTKKIGDNAFYQCSGLTDLTFAETAPDLVLGKYAFAYSGITSLNLPEGLQTISDNAFYGCKFIQSVVIPASVTSIGTWAFYNDILLASVTFAEGSQLETIGANAFCYTPITSISFPQSIKKIDNYAFQNCKSLVTVTFEGTDTEEGSSLQMIGQRAFGNCSSLTSFAFPYCGVDEAGVYNKITLGSGTMVHLFEGDSNLTHVYLSEAVTSISNLFVKCSGIQTIVVAEHSENFRVSETQPIILNVDGTAIQFLFGRMDGVFAIPEGVTTIGTYAFAGQTNITKVIVPKTMKTIGDYAFNNCYNLVEIEFANGCVLDTLGKNVFNACKSLKNIVLPNGIQTIPEYAFAACESLESITLPNNLQSIDQYAFVFTSSLKSITFPNSLKKIMNYAFRSSGLETVTIPEGVTQFGTYVFTECYSLTEATLPTTIKTFANQLFTNCTALTTVNLPEGLTILGGYAFKGCTSLKTVKLPSTLTTFGNYTFQGCTSLESIEIPEGITYIGASKSATASSYAFDGCTALESVTFLGDKVEIIGQYAFRGCTSLRSLTFPTALTTIAAYAFQNSGLEKVVVPSTVTTLGNYAFADCQSLVSANIEGTLKSFGTYMFKGCSNLTDVIIADDNTTIGNYAFQNCENLTNVTLPAKLTTLGTYAFQNCTGLEKITLPASLVKIGGTTYSASAYTFDGCTSLAEVEILGKATYIGAYVFKNCTSLKSITLPSTCTSIGSYAFQNSGLESIDLSKVTTMGTAALKDCANLATAVLPNIAILPNYTFQNCVSLKTVEIPNKTTKIGSSTTAGYVFDGCTALENVKFLGAITHIYGYAFRNCTALKSITIPETVTELGDYAFFGSGIENINVPSKVAKLGKAVFNACPNLATLSIDGANTTYMVYDNKAIVEIATTTVVSVFNLSGDYILPEGVNIASYALNGVTLGTLTLPDTLTTLPNYALYGLAATKVVLGSGLSTLPTSLFANTNIDTVVLGAEEVAVGSNAFENSTVQTIENSENIVSIASNAFKNCKNLSTIALSDKLLKIESNAFTLSGLTSIVIPGSVECLGTYSSTSTSSGSVFKDCENLTSVILNEGLETICDSAFVGTAITSITIPSTVTRVGLNICKDVTTLKNATILCNVLNNNMFNGCTALESVQMSQHITKIPNYAFANCTSLSTIDLPNGITEIGTYAFQNCTSLTQIKLPDELVTIQTAAFANTGLTSVQIPSKVKNIFGSAFLDCANLVSVVLNEGLETLGTISTGGNPTGNVFKNCVNLETITLPQSLQSIGSGTFQNCNKIKSIVIYENCITVGDSAFAGWTSDQKVCVVASLYDITGYWYEIVSSSTFKGYWTGTDAEFVFEYNESSK
ncbi:MAG: leucine-rich repeat protein [Anaeroplasma bactoclasticum]|nr:leucine-rich repeat protein [Anaeroplasma bactoclasticum]